MAVGQVLGFMPRLEVEDVTVPPSPESPVPDPEVAGQGLAMGHQGVDCTDELPTFQPSDEEVDTLESNGVADELLQAWADKEVQAVTPRPSDGNHELPPLVRDMTLNFICYTVSLLNVNQTDPSTPHKSWFEVAHMLDIFLMHGSKGQNILEDLPATCIALVKIQKKFDTATLNTRGLNLHLHAAQLAQWLTRAGYTTSSPTQDELDQQEMAILEALRWQVNLPSIESWLSAFCMRFNVLTHGNFIPQLNWVWQQCMVYARVVVTHKAATLEKLPQRKANGLLGLTFVRARLVPLDALRPAKLSPTMWENLFESGQFQATVPVCVLAPGFAQRVLDLLQVVLGRSLAELQQDCAMIAYELQETLSVASMRNPHVHHASV
mmetsp:Transcript_126644/g.352859  ORF Transcript_126644/g.352859 Transcript_126644/m.352859 type:complete len:379 (-) Transcript_126644:300-1436(-)